MSEAALSAIGGVFTTALDNLQKADIYSQQSRDALNNWYKQQEYNTPANQVKRLREAGLNPAFAMSNGAISSGSASSAPETPDRLPADFSPIAEGIRSSIELYQQKRYQDAEIDNLDANTEAQRIRNRSELDRNLLDLKDKEAELKRKGVDTTRLEKDIEYRKKEIDAFDERNASEVERNRQEASKAEKEAHLADLNAKYQEIVNKYAPHEKEKLLRNLDSQNAQILAAAYAHNTQAVYNLAQKALTLAQKEGVDLANDEKDALIDIIVDEAISKADEAYWNAQESAKAYRQGKTPSHLVPGNSLNGKSYYYNDRRGVRRKVKRSRSKKQ